MSWCLTQLTLMSKIPGGEGTEEVRASLAKVDVFAWAASCQLHPWLLQELPCATLGPTRWYLDTWRCKKKKVEKSRGSPYVFKVEVGKLVYLELGEISWEQRKPMRTPGRTQKNEQQPTWICKDQIGSNQSNFLQWQRGRAGAGGRCRRCHLSLLQEGFSSCLPWHSHQHAGKQLCIAIWLYLERDYQWLPVREGCVYQGSPDLVQFDISINLPDDGRGKMFIRSAEGSPPRKGYQHFGGHETKPSDQDLSPSDGKWEKGPESPYNPNEIQRGAEHSSAASRLHKHQMGYNGLGSSSAEKDPELHLMRSGTDCGDKGEGLTAVLS